VDGYALPLFDSFIEQIDERIQASLRIRQRPVFNREGKELNLGLTAAFRFLNEAQFLILCFCECRDYYNRLLSAGPLRYRLLASPSLSVAARLRDDKSLPLSSKDS